MRLNGNLNPQQQNIFYFPLRQTEWGGDPFANVQDAREEEAAEAAADDTDQRGQEGLPRALALQQQHLALRRQDR